jgi:aldehyde dehydrogenase (NAD+)
MSQPTLQEALKSLSIDNENAGTWMGVNAHHSDKKIPSYSPVDGSLIGYASVTNDEQYEKSIIEAHKAFLEWRNVPAPKRGEAVRVFGNKLRDQKSALGLLVSYEMGKSYQEGLGEVQEMIDICDFAVGLSRQLTGLTIKSERPEHFMMEQYHPMGVIGIISAFNFPVAVWAWNAALAWVCGNSCVWKGSEKTPLCSIACQKIWNEVTLEMNLPKNLSIILTGDKNIGIKMSQDKRIPVVSATGSTLMGKAVGEKVASRLGRSILELGGNNAIIITESADLKMTVTAAVFGAIGTAGQRCTSTRRLIIHESIYDKVCNSICDAYKQIKIGSPLDTKNHMGPLIDSDAVNNYLQSLKDVEKQGGNFLLKGEQLKGESYSSNCYVTPSIAEVENIWDVVQHETFAPLLYVMKYSDLKEALNTQNNVPQGLSSAIMTNSMQEANIFLSASGSDCGIANVNIGTSGAEIGGAFGGEKETGGGRESGSDAWKAYMRRQTNTLNYGNSLPLAQGIEFNI